MLSTSKSVGYIHEPFNLEYRVSGCSVRFSRWFMYITTQNESAYYPGIRDTLNFKYNLFDGIQAAKNFKTLQRVFINYIKFSRYRSHRARPLVKDPIALFSTEWLASRFNMHVVVLVRHPAAFVSSLKEFGWEFPFTHLLEQSQLINDHLSPYINEIHEVMTDKHDIVDQGALLWKLIHHVVIKFKEKNREWIFLRHEDLSRNPVEGFQNLYGRLGINFSEKEAEVIKKHSQIGPMNPRGESGGGRFLVRDSTAMIKKWETLLTIEEREQVKKRVGQLARVFYSDQDW
jgi:hypothetical protein